MKKVIFSLLFALSISAIGELKADPPTPFGGSEFHGNRNKTQQNSVKGSVSTATLLLLGLAGGFGGLRIYRNSKKKD